jgi:phosphopantetheinyl transferase
MPLYKTITVSPNTKVFIWKIEESEAQLREGVCLTKACETRVSSMQSELHRRGFLSVRQLLKAAGYEPKDLFYDDNGRPHLTDGKHISITHSFTFSGLIISDIPVGIDIEKQRDKIAKIAHKFTTFRSYKSLANFEAVVSKLTIIWCAKESLYKLYAQPGLMFIEHIDIQDFDFDTGKTTGSVIYKGNISKYNIDFFEFEGFTCAYGLPA